jgi:RNA polymerase sigma-70 factor (ECF subfamily)
MTVRQEQALGVARERIVGFLASRIGRTNAEDVAQEVVVVLMEKYPHIKCIEDLLPLSVQIAKFKRIRAFARSTAAAIQGN